MALSGLKLAKITPSLSSKGLAPSLIPGRTNSSEPDFPSLSKRAYSF